MLKYVVVEKGVTDIGDSLFVHLRSAEPIVLPNTVTDIGKYAFFDSLFTSIELTYSVKTISPKAFMGIDTLHEITLPESVESVGDNAFHYLNNLLYFTILNPDCDLSDGEPIATDWKYSAIIGYKGSTAETYADEHNIRFIDVESIVASGKCGEVLFWRLADDGTLTIEGYGEMDNWRDESPWCEYQDQIKNVDIAEGVTTIGDYAFWYVYGDNDENSFSPLISVSIPNTVTRIGDNAFIHCRSLTELEIPNSVKTIGQYAISKCDSLTKITLPESVEKIEGFGIFSNKNLKSVTILNPDCEIADYYGLVGNDLFVSFIFKVSVPEIEFLHCSIVEGFLIVFNKLLPV